MHAVPATIGAYRILQRLGGEAGGGDVLLALCEGPRGFERRVVLKRQPLDASYQASLLVREATVCARLVHPAIVRIYDFFEHQGHLVMVREHVEGVSLDVLLSALRERGERLPDVAAFYVAARLFSALAAAHSARDPKTGEYAPVIHRDVSPSNVLVPWDGFVKLADFGFARVCGRASETASGVLKGTYGYMAPEQVLGDPLTVRADIYSASLVLREMLTSELAFPRNGLPELEYLRSMAEPRLAPLEFLRPDISLHVAMAIRRGLYADPDARAMTAELMHRVLRDQVRDLEEGRLALVDTLTQLRPAFPDASPQTRATPPRGKPQAPLRSSSPPPLPRLGQTQVAIARTTDDAPPSVSGVALGAQPTPQAVASPIAPIPVSSSPTPRTRPRRNRGWIAFAAVAVMGIVAVSAAALFGRGGASETAASVGRGGVSVGVHVGAGVSVSVSASSSGAGPVSGTGPGSGSGSGPSSGSGSGSGPGPGPSSTTGRLRTPPAAKSHRIFVDGKVVGAGGVIVTLPCGPHAVKVGSMGKMQSVVVPCGGEATVGVKW